MSVSAGLDSDSDASAVKATATWRVPSQIAELVRETPFETLYLRVFAWVFLICGIFYYFRFVRFMTAPAQIMTSDTEVFLMVGLAEFCLIYLYNRLSNKIDLGPGLRRLRTKVPDDSACPIYLEVVQEDVVTGNDEGYMWIDEGTLYYKGLQTAFRINSPDVPILKSWPRKFRPSYDKGIPPRHILIHSPRRSMRLRIKLINPFEDHTARRRTARFDRGLVKWLAEKPTGSLETLLPPSGLHRALVKEGALSFEGMFAGVCMLAINLSILVTSRHLFSGKDLTTISDALEISFGVVMSYVALRFILSQYKDVRFRNHLIQTELPQKVFSEKL